MVSKRTEDKMELSLVDYVSVLNKRELMLEVALKITLTDWLTNALTQ